jgi:hypothetical protein
MTQSHFKGTLTSIGRRITFHDRRRHAHPLPLSRTEADLLRPRRRRNPLRASAARPRMDGSRCAGMSGHASGVRLSWGELVSFGMDFWSQRRLNRFSAPASPTPSLSRLPGRPGGAHTPPRDPGPGTPRLPRRQVGRTRPHPRAATHRVRSPGVPDHGDTGLHPRASVAAKLGKRDADHRVSPPLDGANDSRSLWLLKALEVSPPQQVTCS